MHTYAVTIHNIILEAKRLIYDFRAGNEFSNGFSSKFGKWPMYNVLEKFGPVPVRPGLFF